MKGSVRTAAALGVGYMLGRQHKLRAAAMLATAAAIGSTPAGGMVFRRGVKMIGSATGLGTMPPGIAEIVDTVRGDLLPAGKAAVSAAATSRVDAVTGALHERAEMVRNPGAVVPGTGGKADEADEYGEELDDDAGEYDEEPGEYDEEPDETGEEPQARVRRTATRRRAPVTRARR